MKNSMLVSLLAFGLLNASVFASEFHWTLERKVSGPSSWTCGESTTLTLEDGKVQLASEGMLPNVYLENANQGIICQRAQKGGLFRTLHRQDK